MTEEEKLAAIQFFGTLHAQAHQSDQNIVGRSQYVAPISPTIKNQFEQVLHAPVTRAPDFTPQLAEVEDVANIQQPKNIETSPEQASSMSRESVAMEQLFREMLDVQHKILEAIIEDRQPKEVD